MDGWVIFCYSFTSRTIGQKATERATHSERVGRKAVNLLPDGHGWAAAEEAFSRSPAATQVAQGFFIGAS
jgi:hypothetical protein